MESLLIRFLGLMCVALLVVIGARRLRLPLAVALLVAGTLLGLAGWRTGFVLDSDLIYNGVLPLLLFEAAFDIRWHELRRDLVPVLVLATVGVLVSAAVVSAGMMFLLGWPRLPALLFGALIAATDPVAVIAMFKDAGMQGRFRLLVESESLLNDGVGAVLFALVVAAASNGGAMGALPAALTLALNVGGATLTGLICGIAVVAAAEQTADRLVKTALSVVAAYGSFQVAEHLHASGVLATVITGLIAANLGTAARSGANDGLASDHGYIAEFWDLAAFVANAALFLLIGLEMPAIDFGALGAVGIGAAVALVLAGRAAAVYPIGLAAHATRWRIPAVDLHVLWWGGLRGVLGIALALSLPPGTNHRPQIIIATFAVVAFSVLVQGGTMPWVLRRAARAHAAHIESDERPR